MKSERFPDLPPLSALVVFEAAACHESFSKAAEELNLSASAVAHQIKKLEVSMAVPLFYRHPRGVQLNPQGQEFYAQIHVLLAEIQNHSARLKASAEQSIRIRTQHAVAQFWLQPRLRAFQNQYDDFEFEITATSRLESLPLNTDLAIGFFEQQPVDGSWQLLWQEFLLPVRSVEYQPKMPVLYLDAHWQNDWNYWQSQSGQQAIEVTKIRRTSLYALVLQSVLDQQGMMMARTSLVGDLIEQGKLIPFNDSRAIQHGAYYLYRSPYSQGNASVDRFCHWLAQLQRN